MSRIATYLVGRDSRCDYRIDDASVSRRHAEVVPASGGRFYVTDRASTGGTFVRRDREWARIRQAWVGPTDRIRFGGHELATADLAVLRGANTDLDAAGSPLAVPSPPVPGLNPARVLHPSAPVSPRPRPEVPHGARKKRPARDPRTGQIVEWSRLEENG